LRLSILTVMTLSACMAALSFAAADAKTPRHKTKARPAAAAPATPSKVDEETGLHIPTIQDAPADDYQRVAWCHGVLSGDMELAEQIAPLEPVDDGIQAIGRSYLRAYEAALTLSGKGKTEDGHALAEKARQAGYDGWAEVRKADMKQAAYAYDTWQLPGDCEHAAVRLSGHPNLFGEMATDDEAKAIEAALNSGGPHNYNELPKPKLTADKAPENSDGPITTNTLAKRAREAKDLPLAPASGASSSSASSQ
jgi:hypothetical protein